LPPQTCREYNIALRTELKRKELGAGDAVRAAELAAYFTHAKLQPVHQVCSALGYYIKKILDIRKRWCSVRKRRAHGEW